MSGGGGGGGGSGGGGGGVGGAVAQNFLSPNTDTSYSTTTQHTNLILHKLTAHILCKCL
jgi:hypothetical protein